MWANYESNVKATIAFLKLLKIKVNNATVDETLQSHPDWPSLLCISDSLNKWHIPNAAGKIDKNDIDQLPIPFIAHTFEREFPLAIVTIVENGFVSYTTGKANSRKGSKTVSKDDFLKIWDGVYLIAEPAKESGEKDFAANKKSQFIKQLIPAVLLAAIVFFLAYTLYQSVKAQPIYELAVSLQFGLLLTGVFVTTLLLWYETDKNNAALKKVCTGIAKGNCDAILSSNQSKLFSWLSWSEVGFFYFTGSLMNLVFAGNNLPGAIVLLSWLSMLVLPYTVFSIYYQWRVAKQWCLLCLAVQFILVLGAVHILIFYPLQVPTDLPFTFYTLFALLFILPAITWYVVKPGLLSLQKAKTEKKEYLRLKFNTEIFDTLLKKQKQITHTADGLGILLGNPAAEHELIKVCNPYCGPCSKAHPEIEKIIEENKNVKARIIFTATNDDNDQAAIPVKHLLAVANSNNEAITKQALGDWYMASKKDYEVFAAKYPMNGELKQQDEKVERMSEWCKAMDVQATPTIFIKGYQMPDAYSIGDLQYFLLA
jgi:uncharacterized membrane protein